MKQQINEYRIQYATEYTEGGRIYTHEHVRILNGKFPGRWLLIDGNTGRNIRPFVSLGEAMAWIDAERLEIQAKAREE